MALSTLRGTPRKVITRLLRHYEYNSCLVGTSFEKDS